MQNEKETRSSGQEGIRQVGTAECGVCTGRSKAAGLKVWNIGDCNVQNMEEVTLNLPGRDKKVEEYKSYPGRYSAS